MSESFRAVRQPSLPSLPAVDPRPELDERDPEHGDDITHSAPSRISLGALDATNRTDRHAGLMRNRCLRTTLRFA